jgi:hypothetical protein
MQSISISFSIVHVSKTRRQGNKPSTMLQVIIKTIAILKVGKT